MLGEHWLGESLLWDNPSNLKNSKEEGTWGMGRGVRGRGCSAAIPGGCCRLCFSF